MPTIKLKPDKFKYILPAVFITLMAAGCDSPSTQTYIPPAPAQTETSPTSTIQSASSTPPLQNAVSLASMAPGSGSVGTKVTINGYGFTPGGNQISFGDFGGRYRKDGTADNIIATASSTDGTTLNFMVPASGPSGILCDSGNKCAAVAAIRRTPGNYNVSVTNSNGSSNMLVFTIQ
ncbi:MAG: hypothetical protein P4L74_01045 [Candidatus Doudnabacteria bacterium]|nr:hypothetical protein [Candidatus Doudnabacteria bacterium]